jgi:hypothetical protein
MGDSDVPLEVARMSAAAGPIGIANTTPIPQQRKQIIITRPAKPAFGIHPATILLGAAVVMAAVIVIVVLYVNRVKRRITERVDAINAANRAAYMARFGTEEQLDEHHKAVADVFDGTTKSVDEAKQSLLEPLADVEKFCTHMGDQLPESLLQPEDDGFDTDPEVREVLLQRFRACEDAIKRAEMSFDEFEGLVSTEAKDAASTPTNVTKQPLAKRAEVLMDEFVDTVGEIMESTRSAVRQVLKAPQ